jgi:hypothetical protein
MSETPDVTPPSVPNLPPAYASGSPVYSALPFSEVRRGPLMLSGALLIVAFVAHLVSYLASSVEVSVAGGVVEALSLIGAYVGFIVAGFPSRSGAARALAVVLILLYAIANATATAFTVGAASVDIIPVVVMTGFGVLIAGVAFGIVSLVTKSLPSPLKAIPLVMYGLVFLLGMITPVISGGGYLVAGIAYLVLAGTVGGKSATTA